jgi:hypothetical protein
VITRTSRLVLVIVIGMLLGGCRSEGAPVDNFSAAGGGAAGAPASGTGVAGSASGGAYAIPSRVSDINASYMTGVLAAIEHVRGDVRRDVYATQGFSTQSRDRLGDIYDGRLLDDEITIFSESSAQSHPDAKADPGDEVQRVERVVAATRSCVVVQTTDNTNAEFVTTTTIPGPPHVIALVAAPGNNGDNPTPWKIEMDVHVGDQGSDYRC